MPSQLASVFDVDSWRILTFSEGWSMYAAASARIWSSKKLNARVMRERRDRDIESSMSEMFAWKGMDLIVVFELEQS